MSDDIVTRLRNALDDYTVERDSAPLYLWAEAADEIERLRAETNVWRGICERFAESDPRFDAFRIYFMAVRGE